METVNLMKGDQEKSFPSLLGLSSSIRQRIYSHIGLVNTDRTGRLHVCQLHTSDRPEFCQFYGLLLSCRTLYEEASRVLYSSNRFAIYYGEHLSLEPLRKLTPHALSNLRYLKVVLNEASCHPARIVRSLFPDRRVDRDHRSMHHAVNGVNQHFRLGLTDHDTVLLGDEGDLKLLAEWERTVEHLSTRISPAVLDISIVCDVFDQDIDIAKRVVSPLALLPPLKNCHVRLSHIATPELSRLARDAALSACDRSRPLDQAPMSYLPASKSQPPMGSALMALPLELRLYILEHTDLVTPWKEVAWYRSPHAFAASRTRCTSSSVRPRSPGRSDCPVHHGCQFVDCWQTYPESLIGCFCRLKHSAFSSQCKCWEPPLPLFLVCRALYKEAQMVFFSQNRFVTHDRDPMGPLRAPLDRSHHRFTASFFLDEAVPRDCLGHLRLLEFFFLAIDQMVWPSEKQSDLLDWMGTITNIRDKLNLPALTIRLVIAQPTRSRATRPDKECQAILAAYDRILSPIIQLGGEGGLAGFYADFEYPWSVTDKASGNGRELFRSKKREMKERAEKAVLGPDRWKDQSSSESTTWGAGESLWMHKRTGSRR